LDRMDRMGGIWRGIFDRMNRISRIQVYRVGLSEELLTGFTGLSGSGWFLRFRGSWQVEEGRLCLEVNHECRTEVGSSEAEILLSSFRRLMA